VLRANPSWEKEKPPNLETANKRDLKEAETPKKEQGVAFCMKRALVILHFFHFIAFPTVRETKTDFATILSFVFVLMFAAQSTNSISTSWLQLLPTWEK